MLSGYNDKLHVLAKTVFEKARNLVITEDRLHVIKSAVRNTLDFFFVFHSYAPSAHPRLA